MLPTKLKIARVVLPLAAVVGGGWFAAFALGEAPPAETKPTTQQPERPRVRTDRYGDPLLPGAIARLGTVRFRHAGGVYAVAFSEDGKLLAASSDDRSMVVIWDRATGHKLREIPTPNRSTQPPTHLRFSADSKRLYGSFWYGRDMTLYAWDVATGRDAKGVPPLPTEARTLGYSPDGREILLLHKDTDLVRWDIEKGAERGRYPKPEGYLSTAALVGERLLVPQFDGQAVILWDAARKKQLWSVKTTRDKNVLGPPMAFSTDGKLFVVEAPPRVIAVYKSVTGEKVRRLGGDTDNIYYSLCISPDARIVAGSKGDGTLRLWDLESGRERVKIPVVQLSIGDVFFAPDAKTFATAGSNNPCTVQLWETATGKRIDPFPGHTSCISSASFSPDGRTAATSSWLRGDSVVRLWDAQTGRLLRALETPSDRGVVAVAISPDGETLAACGWYGDNKVRTWDMRTGRERHILAGHEAGCTCVAFSPDGKRLASSDAYYNRMGHHEGRLCIWDVASGKRLHEVRGTDGAIQRVLFTRDGRHVLVAANGVHVYDADTGQLVGEPFQVSRRIWSLALSADGRLLATAEGGSPVRLWELTTRREIRISIPGGDGHAVDLTPDGRILAAGSSKGGVVLFHWPSGEVAGKLPGEAGVATGVFFSPDGRRLATAANTASSALIWDVEKLVNRTLPAVAKPSKEDLERWWISLRDANPGEAYKAVWRFVAVPEQTLRFLADSLRPVKPLQADVIARLIDDLDSSQFKVRERASRELERLDEVVVVDALRKARKGDISIEQARRIDRLLAKLPGPEQWRATRAVAVLEQIGGPGARKLLTALAAGAPEARLTREAKASLERLTKRDKSNP